MINLAIYGCGNFGFALVKHFDQHKADSVRVRVYDRNTELLNHLRHQKEHLYLHAGKRISERVIIAASPRELLWQTDLLVMAVTSDSTREVVAQLYPHLLGNPPIINTAKALDYQTGRRLSEVVREVLQDKDYPYALFAGGTIAADLFRGEPLGADLISDQAPIIEQALPLFRSSHLRVYPSSDLIGAEYASAFKNVIAILAGMIHGMGLTYGSETHLISRAAYEVERIVRANYGGAADTFSLQSQLWGNDLWMSCTGDSRNRRFGVWLGKGLSLQEALERLEQENITVEGLNTARILHRVSSLRDFSLMRFINDFFLSRCDLTRLRTLIYEHNF